MAEKGQPKIEIDLAKVERLAGTGLSKGQVANQLGFSSTTWHNHQREDPKLDEAYQRGKSTAIGLVENALFKNAVYENNPTAQIFILKNRCPEEWSDRTQLEHLGSIEHKHTYDLKGATVDQLRTLKEALEPFTGNNPTIVGSGRAGTVSEITN